MADHKLAILGAGAWGTALAIAFARHQPVVMWARNPAQCADMAAARVNQRYLKECPFPEGLAVTADLGAALAKAELVIVATPIAGLRATLTAMRDASHTPPILWACKGFEAGSGRLPHEVVAELWPADVPVGVLSGPSFAREVARDLPAAVTIASTDLAFAQATVARLHAPRLRLYANDDLTGVEVGAAVKNVMAIATGVSDGLGYGNNARAALITRGLAEVSRLAEAFGARPSTLMGLAGLGDLVLTCTGELSRNRTVGLLLAQGKHLGTILAELGHVAEGVPTTREVAALAERHGVDMPITRAVHAMLFEHASPDAVVTSLLAREPKTE